MSNGMFGSVVSSGSRRRGGSDRNATTKPAAYYRARAMDEALGGSLEGNLFLLMTYELWKGDGRPDESRFCGSSKREFNNHIRNEQRIVDASGTQLAEPARPPKGDFEALVREKIAYLRSLVEGGIEEILEQEKGWEPIWFDEDNEVHAEREKGNSGSDIVVGFTERELTREEAEANLAFIKEHLVDAESYTYEPPTQVK